MSSTGRIHFHASAGWAVRSRPSVEAVREVVGFPAHSACADHRVETVADGVGDCLRIIDGRVLPDAGRVGVASGWPLCGMNPGLGGRQDRTVGLDGTDRAGPGR